ncbi:MAG: UDP-N-acetylglucosamine pyrophosphorylase [Rickettsiales bacterium TMED289]|nr:MAG: UDP-N-acetylglucosamine pyrophosphorylase [Rickettsiales bacterium TMED289]|tara:strand:- start:671 stop:1291 length:621 start_codon:yes stop_codon:yes gene_type:complete
MKQMENKIQSTLRKKFIKKGVKMISPETIFFSKDTKIGNKVTIDPYVVIGKNVTIKDNVKIYSFSHLENTKIESNVSIGPYARLRPGTVLKSGSKVGNFVEIKKSTIGKNTKVSHLSYVGDATIGSKTNIGAGTITCNYDGTKKHKTKIKNNVFVGSNTSLIAPVNLDNNSIIGAGSVITKNVKSNSLSLTRSNQIEIKNYKRKKK